MRGLGDNVVIDGCPVEETVGEEPVANGSPIASRGIRPSIRPDGGFQGTRLSGQRRKILGDFRHSFGNWGPCEYVEYQWTRDHDDIELVAHLDLDIFINGAINSESAKIAIQWWTHPAEIGDRFTIHYSESSGYNCGWHRHDNEHTDGLDHFQQQSTPEAEIEYEGIEFAQTAPPGIFWEIIEQRLPRRMADRVE